MLGKNLFCFIRLFLHHSRLDHLCHCHFLADMVRRFHIIVAEVSDIIVADNIPLLLLITAQTFHPVFTGYLSE